LPLATFFLKAECAKKEKKEFNLAGFQLMMSA
jgi:hypothetical protein